MPAEVQALFCELLIGVTSFFRDRETFAFLEAEAIPKLFADKPRGAPVRVWSVGCSTGEETYSLAMLLEEHLEAHAHDGPVQVFGTDLDRRGIATARAGVYPASIEDDVSPERLARFFTREADGASYRVNKRVRDRVVFSEHDVIKDPPFSRLDLLSCRNLLIYLESELQRRLLGVFHYALKPGGVLFLGTSETVSDADALFTPLDRTAKIFLRSKELPGAQPARLDRFTSRLARERLPTVAATTTPTRSLREVTEQALLQHVAVAAALVDDRGDIRYTHGRTGMYLEPTPGEVGVPNLLAMARAGLRSELGAALREAKTTHESATRRGLRVKTNGDFTSVDLAVHPVAAELDTPLFLVMLEAAREAASLPSTTTSPEPSVDADARIAALEEELHAQEDYLRSANDELETANQELTSTNEEMQSVNEELRSTNEELETAQEELQSTNEELATVNSELQTRLGDFSRTNNDMSNLLAGTGIGTLFVDLHLRILRFTPAAVRIINLIPADVGRPLAHVVTNLVGSADLLADAQAVLDTLVPKEVRVRTKEGAWYTMRILPYRTLENVIEGAVLTFVDITETVRVQEALRKTNELQRLAIVVRDAHDAITVQDLDGRTLAWNAGAERLYGWTEAEALAMNVRERIPEALRDDALGKLAQLSKAEVLEPYRTRRLDKAGKVVAVSLISTALHDETGRMYGIATTERAVAS
jgi:two-component system CheB/CheR fusion protein